MQNWQVSTKRSSKRDRAHSAQSSAADWCLKIVDSGFAGIVLLAPFLFGGRHLLGRFVFIVLACVVGVAWLTRQALIREGRWTPTLAHLVVLSSLVLVSFQLAPLPAEWISWLAPRNQSLLPLWCMQSESGVALGNWTSISLTPQNTKIALATLIAYYLLFISAIQRIQSLEDIQKLVKLIALSALLMSGFGVLQYLTSNGRFFWFYEYPFSDTHYPVKGSFTCRNHFADFLALGIGPLMAWIVLSKSGNASRSSWKSSPGHATILSTTNLLYAGLVLLIVAVLMTLSRGGAIAAASALLVVLAFYVKRGQLSGANLYGFAILGVLVVSLLSLGDYDKIAGRLDDFAEGSVEELDNRDARRRIWNANLEAIREGGLLGAGAGSHAQIYPAYLSESFRKEYTHAENSYLQIVTENGWIGLALLVSMVLCVVSWCWNAIRSTGDDKQRIVLTGAVVAGLAASLIHAVVDFIWFIPTCLSIALLLAACALRLAQLSTNPSPVGQTSDFVVWARSRWVFLATTASLASCFAVAAITPAATAALEWDQYLLTSIQSRDLGTGQLKQLKADTEQSDTQHMLNELMILQLQKTVSLNPQFGRAHVRLASRYLQLFESNQRNSDNAMPIEQIRDAAIASAFSSSKELQAWLTRAFGENATNLYRAHYHARQAVKSSPLQPEPYLYLAKLCFLQGQHHKAIDAYAQQSLLLQPHSGKVLLEAGWQYFQLGDTKRAIEYWQAVYSQPETRRLRILQRLGGVIPAYDFVELFQPDWHTLPYVWQRYRQLGSSADWQFLLEYAENSARREESMHSQFGAGRVWLALSKMQQELEQTNGALRSLARAYEISPDDYSVRRALGRTLLRAGQLDEAQAHLKWCLARKSDDPRLRGELIKASKQSYLPQATNTSTPANSLK